MALLHHLQYLCVLLKLCQRQSHAKTGFFYKAFKSTMDKFNSDLPKTEMVRYIAVDPVKPEFEVYKNMTVHTGLPEALL